MLENRKLNSAVKPLMLAATFALALILSLGGCSTGADDFVALKAKGLEHIGAGDYEKAQERLFWKKQPGQQPMLKNL